MRMIQADDHKPNFEAHGLWRACVYAGLAALAICTVMLAVVPLEACGTLEAGQTPLLSFQLASGPNEAEAVFGSSPSLCQAQLTAALELVNRIDLFAFIPIYGLFLLTFFAAMASRTRRLTVFAGSIFALVAIAADVVETVVELQITANLPGDASAYATTWVASTTKFICLALICLCVGRLFGSMRYALARWSGRAASIGGLLVLLGLVWIPVQAAILAGNLLAWVPMFAYALSRASPDGHIAHALWPSAR